MKVLNIILTIFGAVLLTFILVNCITLFGFVLYGYSTKAVLDEPNGEIVFQGDKYTLMDVGEGYHWFKEDENDYKKYHFREKGKSILFSNPREYGDFVYLYDDHKVISILANDDYTYYYIRDDVYDEYKTAMDEYNSGVKGAGFNEYAITTFQRRMGGGADYSVKERAIHRILIDEDTAEIINKAKSAHEEELISYDELHANDEAHLIIEVYYFDKHYNDVSRFGAALIKDIDKYYIYNANWEDEKNIYPLSRSDSILIERLFENYPNAIENSHYLR